MRPRWETVGDGCAVDAGPAFKSAIFADEGVGVRLLRGENIEPGSLRWTNTRTWPMDRIAGFEHLLMAEGDLVLGMDRPVVSAGLKLAEVRNDDLPALLVQRVARLRPNAVDGRYLYHWLSAPGFASGLQLAATGTQLPHITLRDIRQYPLPRYGLEIERRIVAILEEHLSDLDDAAASLRHARARLEVLVARSLSLARVGEELSLAQVAAVQGGIQKQAKRIPRDNAFPFLRVANVTASGLDLREVHQIELFGNELTRYRLEVGDLLVVEGNGSPSQIGRAALWDGSVPDCVHQNHLIRVRPDRAKILPEYLEAVWNSPENRSVLTDVASSSSGLHTLSVSKLARLRIPVPSPEVQADAVTSLNEVRESAARLRWSVSTVAGRSAALRRAVLAAAFSGRLTGRSSDTEVISELTEEPA